jgi:hypothetical protein
MAERVIEGMEELWSNWKPRPKFTFHKDDEKINKSLNHKLLY